jgi:predicted ATPase
VSPSYLKSGACRKEFEVFLENERSTGRGSIFPVYFVDFEDSLAGAGGGWAKAIKERQAIDLRSFRFDLTPVNARRAIARLAKSISKAVLRPPSEKPPPASQRSAAKADELLYVESLHLKNFRCFEELDLRFDHQSRLLGRWTCIAGINGAGKSSILQALGVALLGYPLAVELGGERLKRMRRSVDDVRQRAESGVVLRAGEAERQNRLTLAINEKGVVAWTGASFEGEAASSWDEIRPHVIAAYGATRNLSSRTESREESLDVRRMITLFDPLSQLAGAEVLLARETNGGPLLPLVQNVLRQVFGAELQIEFGPGGIRFTVAGKDVVEAIDLPDGFRSAAAWIADLCAIWCEKAPELASAANPADIQAIVLIDEIDLHLHPSLQRELVPRLRTALPKVQWIVTTHSPLVLANFDSNEIIALDRNVPGNIRKLDRQILGFSSDQIYEWLMGTQPTGQAIDDILEKNDVEGKPTDDEVAELLDASPQVNDAQAKVRLRELKGVMERLKP